MRRFTALYGAHPLHLLALLASFAVAGYAAVRLVPANPVGITVWFIGAAVAHDLVLLPLYAIVDTALIRAWRRRPSPALPAVPWINHLRGPLLLSGLLLVVFFPSIFALSDVYERATALPQGRYLENWLGITAALFSLSALTYAVRLRRARSRPGNGQEAKPGPRTPG